MMTTLPDPIALERRLVELEAESIHLGERALAAEQRLARAAQLYAAVSQLHEARDAEEILIVIKEIVANLLGCEEMGIFEIYIPGPVAAYRDGIGIDADRFAALPAGDPIVADVIATGVGYLPADPTAYVLHGRPVAAIAPLVNEGATTGLVVLFSLLRQKPSLDGADAELLQAMGLHAGRALAHARLREQGL